MRRHSIIIFLASFVFFINYNTFATNYSSYCNLYQTSSSSGYEEVDNYVYYNQLMTLSNVKVGFTQDDSNYFFKITADATLNSGSGIGQGHSNSVDNMQPMLYKTANFGSGLEITEQTKLPYADFNNGDLYTIASLNINGVNIGNRRYKYHQSSSTTTTSENVDTNNGDKYFIPNAARSSILRTSSYRYASSFPIALQNNGIGVNLIKNSSSTSISTYMFDGLTYVGDITASIDIELEIEKTYIDDYRYLCFGLNMPVTTSPDFMNNYWKKRTGISVCTDTIDVKSYANCEHSWTVISSDNTKHKIKCSICEWEKEEEHDFKYEYDGIKNDLCECGFKKQIKIYSNFNSSSVTDTTQTIKINATYTYNNSPTKTGYIFKKFKKYINDIKPPYSETKTTLIKTYISDVTTMDTNAGDLSIIYDAQYEPIKYNVKLDSTNNKSVPITITTTNYNNREYDTEYTLPTLTYAGYKFLGWTKTKNSEKVDFAVGTKYKNLTTSNGATITLYPVFAENHYTLKFSKINNLNLSITTDIKDLVCGYGTKYNLPNNIDFVGYNFLGWSLTKGSTTINFVKNAEIYNYTDVDNKEYTLYPVYEPIKYNVKLDSTNNKSVPITITTTDYNNRAYDTEYTLPTLTYAGYKFLGWTKTKNSEKVDIAVGTKYKNLTTSNGATITLYPVFTENHYTLKFSKTNNLNLSITTDIKDLVCGYGTKYNLPDNIDFVGYNFLGWSLTKGSTTVNFVKNAEIYNFTTIADKEYTLYPVYEAKKYAFKFSKENNLGISIDTNIADLVCDYGSTYSLPDNIEVAGYKFLGWTFTKGSSLMNFGENAMIQNYTDIDNKEYILYPVYDYRVYTIKCDYEEEGAKKSILLGNVVVEKKRELPKMKVLPITAKGYGWFYNDKSIESSLDLDKYITKDDEIITIEYKLDKGASAYADDIKEFTYTINCKYWQETETKSITLEKVVIGVKRELPKMKVLPITANNYGWFYNGIKVNDTNDIDPYVIKNNDIITIEYKLDKGSSAYADDVKEFTYTIDCRYWNETATKSIVIKDVKIGHLSELPKIKVLPITAKGYGWFYKENKVASSFDIDQYITKNNETITLEYKLDKGASAYTDDIKEFLYTIDCKYWNETATKSIIIKDVKIGSISELPKIKVLPITAKGYGWFYKENEVVNSLDVDQYVTRNNETITLEYKLDVGASAYTDDVLKFRIAYNADIVGYKKNENISTIEFGKKIELLKLEDVPDNISIYGWYYNDKKNIIYNSEELEQYITKNNQLITLNLNYAIQNMTSISHNSGKGDGGSDSGPGSGSGGGSGNGGSGGSGSGGSGSGPGSSSGESSDEKTATHIMNDYKGEYGPGVENISVIGNANSILTDNSFNIISERDVSYGNNYVNRPFNNNKKEMNIDWSTFCGPRQLTEEDLYYNVRGVHGPWNFDEEYIKVLMEKKNLTYDIATISTIDNENEYSIIDDENEYNIIDDESDDSTFIDIIANKKSVIIIIATILLLIAFIIYEIFTLKSILDKK